MKRCQSGPSLGKDKSSLSSAEFDNWCQKLHLAMSLVFVVFRSLKH